MKQENLKQLLLKDLCARVPYHPKGHVVNACTGAECEEWLTCATFTMFISVTNNCRLYLRPMSSMTEEDKEELAAVLGVDYIDNKVVDFGEFLCEGSPVNIEDVYGLLDWLNAHHFDFRNLIGRGLAIDCTGLNIY